MAQSTSSLSRRIGLAIRLLRRERTGLSQEDFARSIGVHRTYVGVLERGLGNPTVELLERIARGLGVFVSEIVRRAEELPLAEPKRARPVKRRMRLRRG